MKPLEDAIRDAAREIVQGLGEDYGTLHPQDQEQLQATLRSLVEAAQKPQWRPISEAPKEWGHEVMLYDPAQAETPVTQGWWAGHWIGWGWKRCQPTHWTPIPLPPLPETGEEKE